MGKEIQVREQIIRGRPDEVEAAIRASYRLGRLVTRPHNLPYRELPDGQIAVKVHMATEVNVRWRDQHPIAFRALLCVGMVLSALVALAAAVIYVVQSIGPSTLAGVGILAFIVAAALAWNRANHAGVCPGLHCSGCKGH